MGLHFIKNGTKHDVCVKRPSLFPASATTYDNSQSGLAATRVQGAIDEVSAMFGTGSGRANCMAYREEITSITADMWSSIADGTFSKVHVGMHYTAPSGRTYWFADANYFLNGGNPEVTANHMLVIEDEITYIAPHQSTNTTTGGANSSLLYSTTLPSHQSDLETDFGASHIKTASILMSNAVTSGQATGWTWVTKSSFNMTMPMVFGHYLQNTGNTSEMYNGGNRIRQLSLFSRIPELIVARAVGTHDRIGWWLDDVADASSFASVRDFGHVNTSGASGSNGIRRAFLIG